MNEQTVKGWGDVKLAHYLDEEAYRRGIKDFYMGEQEPMSFSYVEQGLVKSRLKCLKHNNADGANKLALKLLLRGIHLVDVVDDKDVIQSTLGYYKKEASCPYPSESIAAKEWQRGVNTAYFSCLERMKGLTNGKHSYVPTVDRPHRERDTTSHNGVRPKSHASKHLHGKGKSQ